MNGNLWAVAMLAGALVLGMAFGAGMSRMRRRGALDRAFDRGWDACLRRRPEAIADELRNAGYRSAVARLRRDHGMTGPAHSADWPTLAELAPPFGELEAARPAYAGGGPHVSPPAWVYPRRGPALGAGAVGHVTYPELAPPVLDAEAGGQAAADEAWRDRLTTTRPAGGPGRHEAPGGRDWPAGPVEAALLAHTLADVVEVEVVDEAEPVAVLSVEPGGEWLDRMTAQYAPGQVGRQQEAGEAAADGGGGQEPAQDESAAARAAKSAKPARRPRAKAAPASSGGGQEPGGEGEFVEAKPAAAPGRRPRKDGNGGQEAAVSREREPAPG